MNHVLTLPPYLTDAEIGAMCEPLIQPAAQCRFLAGKGLLVTTKPNGRPLVLRSELDRVLGAGRFTAASSLDNAHTSPNVAALRDHMNMKNRRMHGARA